MKKFVLAAFCAGAVVGLVWTEVDKLKSRVDSLEVRPYRATIPGSAQPPKTIEEMRREWARGFARALRDEGLVIIDDPVDGTDNA